MPSAISLLYEPLISRDISSIRNAVIRFRASNSSARLFDAVARFAVLAHSPSQHGKHAVLACLAAHQLKDDFAHHYDQILVECAIYAAQSRQPWSEPPMTDPPATTKSDLFSDEEIREAIVAKDRLRAERWLARRMREPRLEASYFAIAAEDLSDDGHKLILAAAAWQLASILGEEGAFATLRIAPVEWTAATEPLSAAQPATCQDEMLLRLLIDDLLDENGSTIAFHRIELFDAALTASDLSGVPIHESARNRLAADVPRVAVSDLPFESVPRAPVYNLGRDYAQYLLSHAIARRLQRRFPKVDCSRIISASKFNLEHGPSFEDWSFA